MSVDLSEGSTMTSSGPEVCARAQALVYTHRNGKRKEREERRDHPWGSSGSGRVWPRKNRDLHDGSEVAK